MRLKPGVKIDGIQSEILLGVMIVESIFATRGLQFVITGREPMIGDFVITSVVEGDHMEKSKHWLGQAIDIRSREIPEDQVMGLMKECRSALGNNFDLVIESDHWHLEYDPKVGS